MRIVFSHRAVLLTSAFTLALQPSPAECQVASAAAIRAVSQAPVGAGAGITWTGVSLSAASLQSPLFNSSLSPVTPASSLPDPVLARPGVTPNSAIKVGKAVGPGIQSVDAALSKPAMKRRLIGSRISKANLAVGKSPPAKDLGMESAQGLGRHVMDALSGGTDAAFDPGEDFSRGNGAIRSGSGKSTRRLSGLSRQRGTAQNSFFSKATPLGVNGVSEAPAPKSPGQWFRDLKDRARQAISAIASRLGLTVPMSRRQAYASQDSFERYLPQSFTKRLGGLLERAEQAMKSKDAAAMTDIENLANALDVPASQIEEAPALILGKDLKVETASRRDQARELIVTGGYVPQFLFSGAATRLGMGAMYNVDVRQAAQVLMGQDSLMPEEMKTRLLKAFQDMSASDQESIKRSLAAVLKEKSPKFDIGLGPREIIEYRRSLEKIARDTGADATKAVEAANLVIHLAGAVESEILADLQAHDFYGFNRKNVFFVTQPNGRGYAFVNGRIVQDKASAPLPAGHGYPMMQLLQKGEAFQLDAGGRRITLRGTVVAELRARGALVMGSHRVNDLTKLSGDTIDPERLAMALALMEDPRSASAGSNMIVEMVANPKNQKGGFWKRDKLTGAKGLAETLNLKTPELDAYMASLERPPYNAFRNFYKISAMEEVLAEKGFSPFIRFRDNRIYPETVTGEASEYEEMRTEAFQKDGELIHDFKTLKDLAEAVRAIAEQDHDSRFAAIAAYAPAHR